MAKINHLILSLPNPPQNILNELNTIFLRLAWSGVDKIKRNIFIKDYNFGGSKLIKVQYFVEAIEVSWVGRLIQKETKWSFYQNVPIRT